MFNICVNFVYGNHIFKNLFICLQVLLKNIPSKKCIHNLIAKKITEKKLAEKRRNKEYILKKFSLLHVEYKIDRKIA